MEFPRTALCLQFNAAVTAIARRLFPTGYDVSETAPQTLEALTDHVRRTGRIVVWSGASDDTIFGCPEHNWAFRAWHDWVHYTHQLEFDVAGEEAVAKIQKEHLRLLYPGHPLLPKWLRIIDAEIVGQTRYVVAHGHFPPSQRAFTEKLLASVTV